METPTHIPVDRVASAERAVPSQGLVAAAGVLKGDGRGLWLAAWKSRWIATRARRRIGREIEGDGTRDGARGGVSKLRIRETLRRLGVGPADRGLLRLERHARQGDIRDKLFGTQGA